MAAIGLLVNSALYLLTVFIDGLMTGHFLAVVAVIATFGINYLVYFFQLEASTAPRIAPALVGMSILCGAFAFIGLFI